MIQITVRKTTNLYTANIDGEYYEGIGDTEQEAINHSINKTIEIKESLIKEYMEDIKEYQELGVCYLQELEFVRRYTKSIKALKSLY